jgi:hypothetical protein
MILTTREERQWFLRNLAFGLYEYLGVATPPVPVEELLKHPPEVLTEDLGVVDMYSNLWDATFARLPNQSGSIFVRIDLASEDRRYVLAREILSALITSSQGRALGLSDLFLSDLRDSAEYFARQLIAPEILVAAYRKRGGGPVEFAQAFGMPANAAAARWDDPAVLLN